LALLLLPLPALAWNAAGHRLVACIAWDYLDAHSRGAVSRLLRAHPDYARWLDKADAAQNDRGVFIEASTWPDDSARTAGSTAPEATRRRPACPASPTWNGMATGTM
jgi:hypothetical protein